MKTLILIILSICLFCRFYFVNHNIVLHDGYKADPRYTMLRNDRYVMCREFAKKIFKK